MQGPTATQEKSAPPVGFGPIRFRAVLLGYLLCVPVTYAVASSWSSAIFSLIVAPVSALLGLVVVNFFLRKIAPRHAFTQGDLIIIFVITSVAGAMAGEWTTVAITPSYAFPLQARGNPQFKDFFMKYIPDWFAIKDLELVKDVDGGGRPWTYVLGKLPVFFPIWFMQGLLMCSVCFAMLCINSLMRRAWCERERLTFPLIQLPVALAENGGNGSMWKSRQMWIAFAVMFSIDILNGLNYLYPNIPAIPVKTWVQMDTLFTDLPWSNIGDFRLSLYPFMAVIGFFMPSDLIFSVVVFFLLRKATHVTLAANGIPQGTFSGLAIAPGPPYFDEQTWGAVLAMFLGTIWVSRSYLKEVWSDIRTGRRDEEDGGLTHRWAFIGLLVSFSIFVGFGVVGKLPVAYMVPYCALFLIFSVVLTRVRAQLGPPTHEFAFFGPNSIMHRFVGNKWLSDEQATYLAQTFVVYNRIYRTHPMPYQLEGMKMGYQERMNQRTIFWLIGIATILGFFLAFFFYMVTAYRTGRQGWMEAPFYLNNILSNRRGPDPLGMGMTILGFVIVLVLDMIRFKIPSFPLHPAGYLLSMNYGVDYYWFGLMLALIIKNFMQRYYGLKGYDRLRAVALGILVGEYAAETIWMTMALITKQSTYTISFNDRSLGTQ